MFYIAIILVTVVILKYAFNINFKEIEKIAEDKELEQLTDRFPENKQIAEEMLEMVENKNVKIEEVKNTTTSLYIVLTNKILIADLKNNYGRIQTIAHECLHSIQSKRLLICNFILSNIFILYWFIISILTVLHKAGDTSQHLFLLLIMGAMKSIIRGYLECDAMIKSRYLAEKYICKKNVLETDESEKLLKKYEKINQIGVPYTILRIFVGSLATLFVYGALTII